MLSQTFTNILKHKDVTEYYADKAYDISACITWQVEIEFRDYGIKDMTNIIQSISLDKEWTTWSEEEDRDITHYETEMLDISDWTIDTDFTNYISAMEIDFRDKKITLL